VWEGLLGSLFRLGWRLAGKLSGGIRVLVPNQHRVSLMRFPLRVEKASGREVQWQILHSQSSHIRKE